MTRHSLLAWDSAFFGYPVARLYEQRVDDALLNDVFDWCKIQDVRCLYYLAPAQDFSSLAAAQRAGMKYVDVRLTLAQELTGPGFQKTAVDIRPVEDDERPGLGDLAPYLAQVSRFSADPHFGAEAARRLFETWLLKEAAVTLVNPTAHGIGGCVMGNIEPDGTGVISLLAVAPESRHQGLGLALCTSALQWFSDQGCTHARVVTQGHNVASQRIYQKAGFLTQSVDVWFHKWFKR